MEIYAIEEGQEVSPGGFGSRFEEDLPGKGQSWGFGGFSDLQSPMAGKVSGGGKALRGEPGGTLSLSGVSGTYLELHLYH